MSETLREAIERLMDELRARWSRLPNEDDAIGNAMCRVDDALLAEHPTTPAEEAGEVATVGNSEAIPYERGAEGRTTKGEREALGVVAYEAAKNYDWPSDMADHILASDWLAAHDAALTAKARAKAWDEGWQANDDRVRSFDNPYREK